MLLIYKIAMKHLKEKHHGDQVYSVINGIMNPKYYCIIIHKGNYNLLFFLLIISERRY